MKKSLLATVAAVALFASTGLVAAEGTKEPPAAKPGQAEMNKRDDMKRGADVKGKDQKTQIRTSVLQSSSAPKVSRSSINFNISVGTVVPRSIHFVTVPETLVRIHPAWRGYSYFIVDEEIIIVDARTLQIIAILVV